VAGFVDDLSLPLGDSLDRRRSSISLACKWGKDDSVSAEEKKTRKKTGYNNTHSTLSSKAAKDAN